MFKVFKLFDHFVSFKLQIERKKEKGDYQELENFFHDHHLDWSWDVVLRIRVFMSRRKWHARNLKNAEILRDALA